MKNFALKKEDHFHSLNIFMMTDSEIVPWGKGEKNSEKKVK
jgi:hypothetical protein